MRIYIGSTLVMLTLVMAVLVSLVFGLDSVYTQIFYIPIILAGLWSFRRAMYVGLLFGFIQIFLAFFLIYVAHKDVSLTDQIVRGIMYVLVAFVVGTLSERQDSLLSKVKESEEKYRFIATSIRRWHHRPRSGRQGDVRQPPDLRDHRLCPGGKQRSAREPAHEPADPGGTRKADPGRPGQR